MQKINFFNDDRAPNLKNRKQLKLFIEKLFLKEKTSLNNIAYIFCSDNKLLDINIQFLKHNYYTDVITFNLSPNPLYVQAEVYISIDRVKENALNMGLTFKEELYRVIFHGALHLCGFKDKNPGDAKIMKSRENNYLKKYLQMVK